MSILSHPRVRIIAVFVTICMILGVVSVRLWPEHILSTPPVSQQPEPPSFTIPETSLAFSPHPSTTIAELIGSAGTSSKSLSSKVAAIIESRPLPNLVPLLLHFSAVLGPSWPIVLFTSSLQASITNSSALRNALSTGQIQIRVLPADTTFDTHYSVSQFLTRPWFWQELNPADHVLLFQSDSIICANAPQRLDDYLAYDFIGAPIGGAMSVPGFNGGFSLRNRNTLLSILGSSNFDADNAKEDASESDQYEDQWFYNKMTQLPPKADGQPGANLPSYDTAQTFAVQSTTYEFPLAYHQPQKWQIENMKQIEMWCPEIRLCTDELLACVPPVC